MCQTLVRKEKNFLAQYHSLKQGTPTHKHKTLKLALRKLPPMMHELYVIPRFLIPC